MYIVIELQTNAEGTVAMLTNQYPTQNEAESKFHLVLGYAAVSSLPKHACAIITEEGFLVRSEFYTHAQAPAPTPEPTPTSETDDDEEGE